MADGVSEKKAQPQQQGVSPLDRMTHAQLVKLCQDLTRKLKRAAAAESSSEQQRGASAASAAAAKAAAEANAQRDAARAEVDRLSGALAAAEAELAEARRVAAAASAESTPKEAGVEGPPQGGDNEPTEDRARVEVGVAVADVDAVEAAGKSTEADLRAELAEARSAAELLEAKLVEVTCAAEKSAIDAAKQLEAAHAEVASAVAKAEQDARARAMEELSSVHAAPGAANDGANVAGPDVATSESEAGIPAKPSGSGADLAAELEKARADAESMKKKFIMAAKKKQSEYTTKLKAVEADRDARAQEVVTLQGLVSELRQAVATAEARATALEDRDAEKGDVSEVLAELDEARVDLERKDRALAEARRIAAVQEQTLLDRENALLAADTKLAVAIDEARAPILAELAELKQAADEREFDLANKSAQAQAAVSELAEKDRVLAERESAMSREQAKLIDQLQTAKAELNRVLREHDTDKENVQAALAELKRRYERAERARQRAENRLVEDRAQWAVEREEMKNSSITMDGLFEASKARDAELQQQLADYKARASALLKQKESELETVTSDTERQSLTERLASAERRAHEAEFDRDQAIKALEEMEVWHGQQVVAIEESAKTREEGLSHSLAGVEKEKRLAAAEVETLRASVAALTAAAQSARTEQSRAVDAVRHEHDIVLANVREELDAVLHRAATAEKAHSEFKELAERMAEAKDAEIRRLLADRASAKSSSSSSAEADVPTPSPPAPNDSRVADEEAATMRQAQQLMEYAKLQAQRDVALAGATARIEALETSLRELERENALRREQEVALKEALRQQEREEKRGSVDLVYLKNVVLKLLETGEREALGPVIAQLLQLSPEEVQRIPKRRSFF